jgi:circadian clock protein KaiB
MDAEMVPVKTTTAESPTPMSPMRLVLRLYVAGDAPNSALARANLKRLLDSLDREQYALEIIDCLDEPLRALEDGVLVTPTLVRVEPEPKRTIVGSLSAADRVANALDLAPASAAEQQEAAR